MTAFGEADVQGPGNGESEQKDDDDDEDIERALLGESWQQFEGIRRVDEKYRFRICEKLRKCSDRYGWGLEPTDLTDIWEQALENLRGWRGFEARGDLGGLMFTLARRRACDLLRRRVRIIYPESGVDYRVDNAHELHELHEYLQNKMADLSDLERTVLEVAVPLYYETFENPSLRDLTTAVNERLDTSDSNAKTEESVASALKRARKKMRDYLVGGYSCE